MYQCKSKNRYIICTSLSNRKGDLWCGLGYFNLNPDNLTDYPYIGIFLEVSPGFVKRPKIIESMQKVINDKPNIWTPENLTILPAWSAIFYRKSLQELLSEKDQLSAIKLFFQESIEELKTVHKQYFNFLRNGVSIEATTEADKEEDLDTSPSLIASL